MLLNWKSKIIKPALVCVLLLVWALDQASKHLVVSTLAPGEIWEVIPGFFNLILVHNRGAAFGLFSHLPDGIREWVLFGTTFAALAVVMFFLVRDYAGDSVAQTGLMMILGGAAGNITDRVRLGEVVDFFDVFVGSYHWPAFNIADSAICLGVVMLLFRRPKSKEK